jgi:hypothetical protein
MQTILYGILSGLISVTILIWWFPQQKILVQVPIEMLDDAFAAGYKKGQTDAYNIVSPPMELEYACANLWVNNTGDK